MLSIKRKIIYVCAALFVLLLSLFAQAGFRPIHENEIQHLSFQPPDDSTRGADGEFYTHLPLIKIETGNAPIPGADRAEGETDCTVTVWEQEGVYHKLTDEPDQILNGKIKLRGNSSRLFDKKGYKLSLYNGELKQQASLAGLAEDDEWILNGPFLDKTMIRNYLSYNIAAQMMEYAPGVRYCELYLNDEYQGLYLLTEKIGRSKSKVNILGVNEFLGITGYIVQLDVKGKHQEQQLDNFSKYAYYVSQYFAFSVDYPGNSKLTKELIDYISKDLSRIERALYTYDYDDTFYGYRAKLDVNNFVDYFIINEFAMNLDAFRKSTYIYKNPGGRLKTCVWDFNNAYDNYIDYEYDQTAEGFALVNKPYYNMLLRDKKFVDSLVNRYQELRKSVLKEEYLFQFIDDTEAFLGPAVERNYEVWGYSFDPSRVNGDNKLKPDGRNPENYEEAIGQLKNFIHQRGEWMDENIHILYQYCADSANINYSN